MWWMTRENYWIFVSSKSFFKVLFAFVNVIGKLSSYMTIRLVKVDCFQREESQFNPMGAMGGKDQTMSSSSSLSRSLKAPENMNTLTIFIFIFVRCHRPLWRLLIEMLLSQQFSQDSKEVFCGERFGCLEEPCCILSRTSKKCVKAVIKSRVLSMETREQNAFKLSF